MNFIYSKSKEEETQEELISVSEQNKELISDFIKLSQKNHPEDFTSKRKYDKDIIKKLRVGVCTNETYRELQDKYDRDLLKDKGFYSGGEGKYIQKYANRVIIPYNDHYFSAKSQNLKEDPLFPEKELAGNKIPYLIKNHKDKKVIVICEGETDSIALKHLFYDYNILGVGGVQSANRVIKNIAINEYEKIIICFDNDEAGKDGKDKLLTNLDHDNIFILQFPENYKDIDEFYRDGGINRKSELKEIHYENPTLKNMDVMSFQELLNSDIKPVSYIIDNLLSEEGITIIGGDSKVGKSWIALYLSLKLSGGYKILDTFNCKKSKILYIDEENGERAIYTRVKMLNPFFKNKKEEPDFNNIIYSNRNNVKLDIGRRNENEGITKFKGLIKKYKPDVCVIDSFVRFFLGEENSSSDVGKVYDTLKWAIKEHKTSFILLHHTTKNNKSYNKDSLRGSGDLAAQCDNVLMCSKLPRSDFIKVEQVANRHDKELDKPFNIMIKDVNGLFSVTYGGSVEVEKESLTDESIKRICDVIAINNWVEFSTKALFNEVKSKGIKQTNFYAGLDDLLKHKILKKIKKGHYSVFSSFKEYYEKLNGEQ